MADDVTVQALDAAVPASAGDSVVPGVPMPLVGASLPAGRTLWFCNRKEPVGLGRGTVNFIVQHGGRLWRVEEEVIYLRLSPYAEGDEAGLPISRESSR